MALYSLPKLLVYWGMASSRTEAERLIKAGAVEIDGEKVFAMLIEFPTEVSVNK